MIHRISFALLAALCLGLPCRGQEAVKSPRETVVIDGFTCEKREDGRWYELSTGEAVMRMKIGSKYILGPQDGGKLQVLLAKKKGEPPPRKATLKFGLAGTWKVLAFGDKGPRREFQWTLKRWQPPTDRPKGFNGVWEDTEGLGKIVVMPTPDAKGRHTMLWQKPGNKGESFMVEVKGYGSLILTGEKGEQFTAVRTDGGEGDKFP